MRSVADGGGSGMMIRAETAIHPILRGQHDGLWIQVVAHGVLLTVAEGFGGCILIDTLAGKAIHLVVVF